MFSWFEGLEGGLRGPERVPIVHRGLVGLIEIFTLGGTLVRLKRPSWSEGGTNKIYLRSPDDQVYKKVSCSMVFI